jgi:hypothetical protein
VLVVERLNRTGRRLDTDLIKIRDGDRHVQTVRDEQGGMRFNFGMHELMALDHQLGLCDQLVPSPMAPTKPVFGFHYFLRSNEFTAGEADASKWAQLYNLSQAEQGKTPSK